MARILEEVELPSGQRFQRIETDSGTRWQRPQNRQFVSEGDVRRAIEQNNRGAINNKDPENKAKWTIPPQDNRDFEVEAIKQTYPEYDNVKGLNPSVINEGEGKDAYVKSWMRNESLRNQVRNDPLVRNLPQGVRQRVIEAHARELVEQLDGVSERQRIAIIRRYGGYE
jgi:hypothetical protein